MYCLVAGQKNVECEVFVTKDPISKSAKFKALVSTVTWRVSTFLRLGFIEHKYAPNTTKFSIYK